MKVFISVETGFGYRVDLLSLTESGVFSPNKGYEAVDIAEDAMKLIIAAAMRQAVKTYGLERAKQFLETETYL